MSEEIKVLRLKSGEEVLCVLKDDINSEGIVRIKMPMLIIPRPTQTGTITFSLFPFMMYTEEAKTNGEFTIKRSDVLLIATPQNDMINQYKEYTGEGIITQTKQIITG